MKGNYDYGCLVEDFQDCVSTSSLNTGHQKGIHKQCVCTSQRQGEINHQYDFCHKFRYIADCGYSKPTLESYEGSKVKGRPDVRIPSTATANLNIHKF